MQPKEYTTPDGCVTFFMCPRTTIDVEIQQDQLDRSLPDFSDANKSVQNLIFAYKLCLAHTEEIRFNDVGEDSEWHDFKTWWEEGKSHNPLDQWKVFSATFDREEINMWVDAYDATRSKRGKAPETLHPGAEQRAIGDLDFLEGGSETPANGGNSSEELQQPKKPTKQRQSELEPVVQNG